MNIPSRIALSVIAAVLIGASPTSEIARKVTPAVVLIKGVAGDGGSVAGSGFIVDPSGTIITNLHVIEEMKKGGVKLASGDLFDEFTVRAFDRRRDIAVVQIHGFKLPVVELADSDSVQQGDAVALIGSPFELEGSFSTGVVSAIRSSEEGFRVIQTDAAANPGNSGGPLVDADGHVIGILTFKRRGSENVNFVVPINYARALLSTDKSLTLDQLRVELATAQNPFQRQTSFPARWKSLESATPRTLRVDGDFVYIEILLPEDQREAGAFMIGELRKSGDKYVGRVRHRVQCSYSNWLGLQHNMCSGEWPIEITLLTPTRIEGTITMPPQTSKHDCAKCSDSIPPVRQTFVWIPE